MCQRSHAAEDIWEQEPCQHGQMRTYGIRHRMDGRARGIRKDAEGEEVRRMTLEGNNKSFWWRCAYGAHPFSSRTRRLRRKRPMVLCRGRHGRAGGCQIKKGLIAQPVRAHA